MPGEFSRTIISLFHKREAAEQGGLLSGKDPTEVNTADPLRLWIIQVGLIVATASLLSVVLKKIRQPKVIAEVLGGIILGPTAFGRIPGFTKHIFPPESRSYLSLVANIGLCLFLFLVGLEIDAGVIKRNARLSASIALAGMTLPFGIGVGIAMPIYKEFIEETVKFTHFMLFVGVAFSITAFPVLARILTELKLLDTTVGIVVLSAGVGNDIVGWTLLALSVALVNAGSGLTALYILLVCVGWTLVILFPAKWILRYIARLTGSIENGPSVLYMTIVVIFMFGSAFFTDIIGVHAIFGAFLAGLIVPREGGLAIVITEKLEDMVAIIFLPLYFTLSGLSTDLGLLNTGKIWGYTIAIMVLAFIGKFGGCVAAARFLAGFGWRESGTVGALMSCKGLVELIVLNVGLSAGILSQRVFSMFVLEALVLTFMTTPLVTVLYPPHIRKRISSSDAPDHGDTEHGGAFSKRAINAGNMKTRFTVVLDKLEHLPAMMAITQLIQPQSPPPAYTVQPCIEGRPSMSSSVSVIKTPSTKSFGVSVDALRLIELSDRTSTVMKSSATEFLLQTDPVLSIFKMFGRLNDISISPRLSIVPFDDLAYNVAEHARRQGSHMIVVPWLPPQVDSPEVIDAQHQTPPETTRNTTYNPFEILFRSATGPTEKSASVIHSQFVRGVFMHAKTDVALFVDQSEPGSEVVVGSSKQHLFLPFFGGPDDRLALDLVVQLCENPKVSATVLKITKREATMNEQLGVVQEGGNTGMTITSIVTQSGMPDTVYGQASTEIRLQSDTADNVAWAKYVQQKTEQQSDSCSAMSRVELRELGTPHPLQSAIQEASDRCQCASETDTIAPPEPDTKAKLAEEGTRPSSVQLVKPRTRLLVVAGRSRRMAVENHVQELKKLIEKHGSVGSEVKKTVGDVAAAFVVAGVGDGIVVVQAAEDVYDP
ncbi:hypothetical protein AMATHDRAFT_194834 [Amanita thiersii Skay4041]|uniref:Cation/H+ exchanger transmembrane domain-containing protein n=1 Tax=Amanita thiersii Skay4041 TaxID=703135 RepID=A0A2A9NPA0_9AGAR|nr:hypothetical protein AMATHDRAFT_194834 [Amanita thiersii Skay4041]